MKKIQDQFNKAAYQTSLPRTIMFPKEVFLKSFIAILGSLLLTSCTTTSRSHDPAQPAHSWDASCESENLPGMSSCLLLTCTMTNRSTSPLTFESIDRITSENDAWRQPDAEELAQIKRDLQSRKTAKTLPLMLNGGDRLEGFIAQMVVVSGLWLTQSIKDPLQLPEKTARSIEVQPAGNVRQAFVLYRDSQVDPSYVTLISADGRFQKQVNFAASARQRISTPK
jgi:hypothetical protein